MLRRIPSLRPRRPRFPEGEVVPWSGIAFVGATCSLALGAMLASAGDVSARHWQAIAVLTVLAALTPLPRALVLVGAIGCYACILTGADALFGRFARGASRLQLPATALAAEAA